MACGGGAAYLWVAAACSIGSLFYVLAKAVAVFGVAADGAPVSSCMARASSSPWPTGPAAGRSAGCMSSTG